MMNEYTANKPKIINLLSHDVSVKINEVITCFPGAKKYLKPVVIFKTKEVYNPYIPLDGGDKVVVKINNIPKLIPNTLYIVNHFILDALVEKDAKYAAYFIAPGKQVHGKNGKISYAENFYYKELKDKK